MNKLYQKRERIFALHEFNISPTTMHIISAYMKTVRPRKFQYKNPFARKNNIGATVHNSSRYVPAIDEAIH